MDFNSLKWGSCERQEKCEKGVLRATNPRTPFLGECPPPPSTQVAFLKSSTGGVKKSYGFSTQNIMDFKLCVLLEFKPYIAGHYHGLA